MPRAERKSFRECSYPLSACGEADCAMISIYDEPGDEPLITCPACLDWLAQGDNRLFVTPGGTNEWIQNHLIAGNPELWYVDVPADDEGTPA
jgi:hypothetical protein